ncbi:hypothetical protein DFH06DRAFT_1313006 [Mycena polygramma]|nr:hypothetical protein DFH06DRAFT_1313006 [Mycena polygramma]
MSAPSDVRLTIGAFAAGALTAVGLSAVLGFQTFLYFQIFPGDAVRYKLLVAWIWMTDAAHTIIICTSVWEYAIINFGNPEITEKILTSLPVAVAFNALTTLTVNLFYGWRIHKMSKSNWWLTGPLTVLCVARTALALAGAIELILTKSFPVFQAKFSTLLTCALASSAGTDLIVSAARYYYLRNLKQGYTGTQEVVDAVVVFTINDGLLTCAVALAVIICLHAIPNSFVWVGVYFGLAKLYSNSVLATYDASQSAKYFFECRLNLRNWFRHRPIRPMGIPLTRPQALGNTMSGQALSGDKRAIDAERMEVFVDQQVEYNVAATDFMHMHDDEAASSHSRKSVTVT